MFEAFKTGAVERAARGRPHALGGTATTSPRSRRPGGQGGAFAIEASCRHDRTRVQYAAPVFVRSASARGHDLAVRLRMDQPHALSWPVCAHAELLRALRPAPRRPPRGCARDSDCSLPTPAPSNPRSWTGRSLRQSAMGGRNRVGTQTQALALLKEAGYRLDDGTLVNRPRVQPFAFEILARPDPQDTPAPDLCTRRGAGRHRCASCAS